MRDLLGSFRWASVPAPVSSTVEGRLPDGTIGPHCLLLADCRTWQRQAISGGFILGSPVAVGAPLLVGQSRHAMVMRCERFGCPRGYQVESLLVRPFYAEGNLERALTSGDPLTVVAYWRRYGMDWCPRSIWIAERLCLGIGGSCIANLVPLAK